MIRGRPKKVVSTQVCRLCGVSKNYIVNLYSQEAKMSGLVSRINSHLTEEIIHIAYEDGLSKYICTLCEMTIKNFVKFCETVKGVQTRLKKEKKVTSSAKNKTPSKCRPKSSRAIHSIFQAASDSEDNEPDTLQVDLGLPVITSSAHKDVNVATVSFEPNKSIVCMICETNLDTVEHITLHMVTHGIGAIICSCRVCGKQGNLEEFIINTSGKEFAGGSVWCRNGCFSGKKTKTNKVPVVLSSPNKGHACGVCPKTFRSQAHKSRHAVIHSGDKPFLCDICGIGFSQIESLKVHNLTHAETDPHICSQCGQKFRFKVSLRSHILTQHGPNISKHVCDRCGKQFASVYKLRRHYRQHTGEKPYECTYCRRLFSQTGNLKKHIKKMHKLEEIIKTIQVTVPTEVELTEAEKAVQIIQPSKNLNLLTESVPNLLETIHEDSEFPCSSTSSTSNRDSRFVKFSQNLGKVSSRPNNTSASSHHAAPPSGGSAKLNRRKGLVQMFAQYDESGLLYVDEPVIPQKKIPMRSEGLTLPKFSSLQSGASGSILTRVHSINKM